MTALNNSNNEKKCFFLDEPRGSGKTYFYKALYYAIKRSGRTIIVALSGIAANLLHKGRTYHSRFKVPLILKETSVCEIHDSSLIIWDEAILATAFALQSKDRLLKDIQCKSRLSFDGKVIILDRGYRQCMPVIPGAQASDFVHASINEWLIKLGNRQLMNTDCLEKTLIEISSHMISKDIVKDIFGEILFVNTVCKFSKKVILTHTNEEVNKINQSVLYILQGEKKTYLSTDSLNSDDTGDVTDHSFEFLNFLTPSGTLPHALYLKKGAITMLLRNLNTERGFCNGTRLIVCEMKLNLNYIFLPRIDLKSDAGQPFQLKRRQFLIRLAFAMKINKAPGRTLDKISIFLPTPVFGKILPGSDKIFTKNVVYKAVLENCAYITIHLEEAQLAKLYNEIEKRKLHSKLYNARKNELVSVSDSSRWLKRGNIRPRNEAVFCYIQDRNVFWGADGMCQHCGKSGKTVDHLATRCEKMLGHDYTRRH
ncbi:PIF1-like helicase, partial [Hamiltosporidium magnivora]